MIAVAYSVTRLGAGRRGVSFISGSALVDTCWNQRSFDSDVCTSAEVSITVRQVADDDLPLDIQYSNTLNRDIFVPPAQQVA
jgi:hypothetical protein